MQIGLKRRSSRAAPAALATAFLSMFAAGFPPAGAQEVVPAVPTEDAATCLCLERDMPALRAEMELRLGILQEREGELERLGMDIEVKRAAMAPGDEVAIAELKTLIERQLALRQLVRRDIIPSYQGSVERLNAVTATYNETCAGRRVNQSDIDRLRDSLQCPRRN